MMIGPARMTVLSTILIVFWTWGRELEASFDDANTQKLSRVILSVPRTRLSLEPVRSRSDDGEPQAGLETYAASQNNHDDLEVTVEETDHYLSRASGDLIKLERIPVMAIFHRNDSAGRGVPHSFASFLHRYPALPQVVVRC